MARYSSGSRFYGYPDPKEGPKTEFSKTPLSNPVVRGRVLAIAGSAAASLNFVSSFLWGNAGFDSLRKLQDLDNYEPRYDPTVIPIPDDDEELETKDTTVENSEKAQYSRGYYSVSDFHAAYRSRSITPREVAETLLDLFSAPEHKASILFINREKTFAAADASTERYKNGSPLGALDGVPVTVKDEFDLDGFKKCLGTKRDYARHEGGTSWCAKKWQEAGAIIVAKTNMHELGLDTTNNNPIRGTPLNPHCSTYYTGGSSGGSAYAVAAGLCCFSLGADGGGSIRIPSNYCGLYGLKPSHGRVSKNPTIGLARSNGVDGPMATNMADLNLAYRVLSAPDPNDATSSLFKSPLEYSSKSQPKVIGVYPQWFAEADQPVQTACNDAISHYKSIGYEVVEISIPYLAAGQTAHAMTILTEISTGTTDLTGLTAANKILISVGSQTPATDFFLAQKLRNLLMQHLAYLFHAHPGLLIVTPTTPNAGWHIEAGDLKHGVSDANMSVRSMTYVWLANFTGCPAISIPVGTDTPKTGEGRVPVGLMAMGEWGNEEGLLEFGRDGEKWAMGEGKEKVGRARGWVDVVKLAKERSTRSRL